MLIAQSKADDRRHALPTILLGEEGKAESRLQRAAVHTRIDVGRRRVERLAGGDDGVTPVALEERVDARCGSDVRPVRLVGRDEESDRPVRGLEILARHALDVLDRHLLHLIPVIEEQAPIAHCHPLAQLQAEPPGVRRRELEALEYLGLGALDFLVRRRLGRRDLRRHGEQRDLSAVRRLRLLKERGEEQAARVMLLKIVRLHRRRLLRFD